MTVRLPAERWGAIAMLNLARLTAVAIGALITLPGPAAAQHSTGPARLEEPALLPSAETPTTRDIGAAEGAVRAASEVGGADLITMTDSVAGDGSGLPVEAQIAPLDESRGQTALAEHVAALGISAERAVLAVVVLLPIAYWIWTFVARQRRRARRRRRAREKAQDYSWQ